MRDMTENISFPPLHWQQVTFDFEADMHHDILLVLQRVINLSLIGRVFPLAASFQFLLVQKSIDAQTKIELKIPELTLAQIA